MNQCSTNGRNGGTGLNGENVADFERLGKGIMLLLLYGMGPSNSLLAREKSIEYLCDYKVFYFIGLMSSFPYIEHAAFKESIGLSLDEFFEKRADEWYYETFDAIYEYGTFGNDVMNFKDATNPMIIYGRSGDDKIIGAIYKANVVYGGIGNDTLYGESGDNEIRGGMDCDYIEGEEGDDKLYDNRDNDEIYGDEGDNLIVGGYGVVQIERSVQLILFRKPQTEVIDNEKKMHIVYGNPTTVESA